MWDYQTSAPSEGERADEPMASDRVVYTRWIAREPDGEIRELGRRRGLWVFADGGVWQMRHGAKTWTSASCAALDGDPDRPRRVVHTSRSVEFGARDGRTFEVISAHDTPPGHGPDVAEDEVFVGEYTQHHAPVAGVGPLIIFRSTTYSYECGAHGGFGSSYLAVDLADGAHEDLLGQARALGEAPAHLGRVRSELIARDAWEGGDLELTAVYPRVGLDDGRLVTRFQYTTGACYACSDGAWSSYSVSAEVVSTDLPASLRPHATVPPLVVKALAGVDQEHGFGWSAVPSTGEAFEEVAEVFTTERG